MGNLSSVNANNSYPIIMAPFTIPLHDRFRRVDYASTLNAKASHGPWQPTDSNYARTPSPHYLVQNPAAPESSAAIGLCTAREASQSALSLRELSLNRPSSVELATQ